MSGSNPLLDGGKTTVNTIVNHTVTVSKVQRNGRKSNTYVQGFVEYIDAKELEVDPAAFHKDLKKQLGCGGKACLGRDMSRKVKIVVEDPESVILQFQGDKVKEVTAAILAVGVLPTDLKLKGVAE